MELDIKNTIIKEIEDYLMEHNMYLFRNFNSIELYLNEKYKWNTRIIRVDGTLTITIIRDNNRDIYINFNKDFDNKIKTMRRMRKLNHING